MLKRVYFAIVLIVMLLAIGCSTTNNKQTSTIYVSILPLRNIVERIVEDDFPIKVLAPAGAAVESYELTPRQYVDLNRAQMIFTVGLLPFENMIISKIGRSSRVVDLSCDIDLIAGGCDREDSCSNHGVDPHIWTSPRELQFMARTCYKAIAMNYPDSVKYRDNYVALRRELDSLDVQCQGLIKASGVRSVFIYHPALTYYARAYGIEQISIEDEGKEPSARRLSRLIEQGRKEGVKRVLYQSQFPASTVEIIARDLGAEAVEIDPLADMPLENILNITKLIVAE